MAKQSQYERLLTTKEAAAFLGMSSAFLERDRCEGPVIPFIRIGNHRVRYSLSELEAYIGRRGSRRMQRNVASFELRKRRRAKAGRGRKA